MNVREVKRPGAYFIPSTLHPYRWLRVVSVSAPMQTLRMHQELSKERGGVKENERVLISKFQDL